MTPGQLLTGLQPAWRPVERAGRARTSPTGKRWQPRAAGELASSTVARGLWADGPACFFFPFSVTLWTQGAGADTPEAREWKVHLTPTFASQSCTGRADWPLTERPWQLAVGGQRLTGGAGAAAVHKQRVDLGTDPTPRTELNPKLDENVNCKTK